jgi:hypothetical protein
MMDDALKPENQRIANMTSFESNESKTFKFDSICQEIWQPDLIVLPIPEKRFGVNNSVNIGVYITNKEKSSFRLNIANIMPETITVKGQLIPNCYPISEVHTRGQTNTVENSFFRLIRTLFYPFLQLEKIFQPTNQYLLVKAKETTSININVKVFWHGNILTIEFFNIDFTFIRPSISSLFDGISPENYQLRFIYLSNRVGTINLNSIEAEILQETDSKQLATPFINIHLVQPVETNRNAIEVDNIQFETVLSENLLTMPDKNCKEETALQIGMRVTNNTSNPLRFDFYATLIPELVSLNGQALDTSYFCPRLESSKESDYPLVCPGESVTHFQFAKLFWFKNDQLRLQITAEDGSFWIFHNVVPSVYQIRFVYKKNNLLETNNSQKNMDLQSLSWVSKTIVCTPFVELSFISLVN